MITPVGNEEKSASVKNLLADGRDPWTPEALFALLDRLGIAHQTIAHPPVRTVKEAKSVRPRTTGGYTKNLFVRNRKAQMWLLTLDEDRVLDLKGTARALGAKSFTFGRPERLMAWLGVKPGSVSPFALVNDAACRVRFAIDPALLEHDRLHLHPLDNRLTTTIATTDLLRFLEHIRHAPVRLPGP